MKIHTTAGAAAFDKLLKQNDAELFRVAHRICLHHHERRGGAGYPSGLSGGAIPLESRIMAFADVCDALLSRRVYKQAMSMEATQEEIRTAAGTQLDPYMGEIVLENIQQFEEIHTKYRDERAGAEESQGFG